MAKRNVLTRSKRKKAEGLLINGDLSAAKCGFEEVCRIDKADADAWLSLGIINRKLGLFRDAENCCRRAIDLGGSAKARQMLGAALQCQGEYEKAISQYRKALGIAPNDAEIHYFLGNAYRECGSMSDAIGCYRRAVDLRQDFVEALSNLGIALLSVGEKAEALAVLNKAVVLRPHAPQILCNLGSLLQDRGDLKAALSYYERAMALDPNSVDTMASIATLLEKTYRLEEARCVVKQGLGYAPDNPELNFVAAKLARREGRVDEAISILERVAAGRMTPATGAEVHTVLGQMYDRAGNAQQAFTHFLEGNRLAALAGLHDEEAQYAYLKRLLEIQKSWELEPMDRLRQNIVPAENPPIFLFGFPRSGTTLLEQILDAHPRLQSIEEKPPVAAMENAFIAMTRGRTAPLASLTESEILELRAVYFREVERHIKLSPGSKLVDKMPLHTPHAHLIWRIFPDAKFILAIRHPCDVCLSCFMQNFGVNQAMASFFTLENTCRVYAEVMRLWQSYERSLPLAYHRVRYEDLVANVQYEGKALTEFLELEWDDAMLKHTEHAKKRGTINTMSYHQVTQPIYQHAKYRWTKYAVHFEPFMPLLQPFVEYFGYSTHSDNWAEIGPSNAYQETKFET